VESAAVNLPELACQSWSSRWAAHRGP